MALGDPLQVMALTRLSNPTVSLAVMGIIKAVANFLESPVIVMLHVSTALAPRSESRRALWRFMLLLSAILTLFFLALWLPPVYSWLFREVFAAPPEVAQAGRIPFLIMVVWPALIAWRRYFQGQLIDGGSGHTLGLASAGRILTVVGVLACGLVLHGHGPLVAASALVGGILAEALLITLFAVQKGEPRNSEEDTSHLPVTLAGVARFYAPLALSMVLVWGGRAALVGLIGRSLEGTLALASWMAGWGIVLPIANATRMVQQITISSWKVVGTARLMGYALVAGALCSLCLAILGWTDLGHTLLGLFWGGDKEIGALALAVVQLGVLIPCMVAAQNVLQGVYVAKQSPWRIQWATMAGTLSLLTTAWLLSHRLPGASAAAVAMLVGLALEIAVLAWGLSRPPSTHEPTLR